MKNSIILERYAALTSLGNLEQTLEQLLSGASGIQPGDYFGMNIPCAPFPDDAIRDIRQSFRLLHDPIAPLPAQSTVFIYAAAKGDIRAFDSNTHNDISPLLDRQAHQACTTVGYRPEHMLCVSNACASGAIAVEIACELLLDNQYDQAVIFGFDTLSEFVLSGFHSLNAVSFTGAKPFDANRDGLSLGESATLVVLSRRRSRTGDIVIAGTGSSNDANHRTGPSRSGDGLWRAARAALDESEMKTNAIGALKCHGTATVYNDAMEAKAITRLFGTQCPPPCFSVKGALGHTSGGGSLLETCIAAECIKSRCIPPTAGYKEHGVDEPIPIGRVCRQIEHPSIVCLAAGFGGVNAALVLREHV